MAVPTGPSKKPATPGPNRPTRSPTPASSWAPASVVIGPSIPHAIEAWERFWPRVRSSSPVWWGASCDDDAVSAVRHPDRVGLATVFAQIPGKWVAVDLDTNEPRVVADSPAEMVAEIRCSGIDNVAVVRAPETNEPQLVGLG